MTDSDKKKGSWKQKIFHEAVGYWVNVCYLTLVFAAFAQYRRFLLASHDIIYTNYWVAVIEALILAKVILVGEVVRLGRGLEKNPLIFPTLYKTVVFTLFVAVVKLAEHGIRGLWKGEGFSAGLLEYFANGPHEFFANSLVVFATLIPFFAVKELGRVLGADKIRNLFFRRGSGDLVPPDRSGVV